MASMFERVVSVLFGSAAQAGADVDRQLVDEMTQAMVETVEPRVRLRSGYREKLAAGVRGTIVHLRELAQQLPQEAILLSRQAWSDDAHVRAFFAAATDVSTSIGRCDELRQFFDGNSACEQAYALLGMQHKERQVLAPRLEGEVLRQEVVQTTVSFSDHRLLAPAADLAQARLEVGRRIMQRLAQLVLERIVGIDQQVQDLQMRKAKLGVRLRMLHAARDGMQPLVSEGLTIEEQIREVERELKATAEDYAETRGNVMTLDGTIDHINAVLGQPQAYVMLERTKLRVSRMGMKVDDASATDSDELDLAELSIGDGLRATIAFVRIPRDELPPKEDMVAQALRSL